MARLAEPDVEAGLRGYLIAQCRDFRQMYVRVAIDGSDAGFAEYVNAELSKPVDQLESGREYRLHRWELPEGHPMAAPRGGRPCDGLVLGVDDVLRAV